LDRLAGEKLCLKLVGDTDVSQREDNLLVDWQQLLFFYNRQKMSKKIQKKVVIVPSLKRKLYKRREALRLEERHSEGIEITFF
jgi:hypothetical protein